LFVVVGVEDIEITHSRTKLECPNALKLTYSNLIFHFFSRRTTEPLYFYFLIFIIIIIIIIHGWMTLTKNLVPIWTKFGQLILRKII